MKYIITKILLCFFFFTFLFQTTFALDSKAQKKVEQAYNQIATQLQKNKTKQSFLLSLKKIEKVLLQYANTPRITSKNTEILSSIQTLNHKKIFAVARDIDTQEGKNFFQKHRSLQSFTYKIYNDDLLSLENGVWYTYLYKNYYQLSVGSIDIRVLKQNGIDPKTALVIYKKNNVIFVKNYTKLRLVKDSLISGVADKKSVLELLKKYVYRTEKNENLDGDMQAVRMLSHNLSKGKIRADEKIESVYNYILQHIEYKIGYDIKNPAHFSGLKTFRTKTGVCEGYVELFKFLLAFQGITVDFIGGDVITAEDFGTIGHAWARIGSYYYDPTFDDPIGATTTRSKEQYVFYKLPKDLFYSNRFDEGKTPRYIQKSDLKKRKVFADQRLEIAARRYKNATYNILKELRFRQKASISIGKQVSITDLKKAVKETYASQNLKTVQVGGTKKYIQHIKYFELENNPEVIEGFLFQFDYDVSDFILLIDTDNSGNIKYYFSKEYTFR